MVVTEWVAGEDIAVLSLLVCSVVMVWAGWECMAWECTESRTHASLGAAHLVIMSIILCEN
ncbi:unnamed protein product [Strongylus vulgaris]|uniref:Uncharacterized protein n=1 Tax=Strongylus vulgaris TaxID=40348 RepID=A0A3P7KH75_STRVU|nr:unnamed protein product [Strongylus vulgaris]